MKSLILFAKLLWKKYGKAILIVLSVLFVVFAMSNLRIIIILGILALLNVIVAYSTRGIPYLSRSFELIMLSTVISGYAYGAKIGFIFGMVSCLLFYVGGTRVSYYALAFVPLYGITGVVVSLFDGYPIFIVGITAAIVYTIISSIIVILFLGARPHIALIFFFLNTFINLILFKYAAPLILTIT